MVRHAGTMLGLLLLWATAGFAGVELDTNGDGKIDDLLLPSTITRDSELSAGLAGKQNTLGFTPEDAAHKGQANGYAGLGADGKVPAGQLPASTGTDDQTASEVPATPWGSYTAINVQALMLEVDTALRALVGGGGSMTWPGSAGVAVYGGSNAWGSSLLVGSGANNLVQLNGSAQLPAVSAALLTNFPILNQNTTGTAAGLTAQYINWESASGGSSIGNKPTLGTASALNVGTAAGNIVQLDSSGALPAVSAANLTNLPSASLPSWLPSTGPTADNQIIQATAAGSSGWTDVFDGLINDAGTGTDDLLSAAEITSRMTSKMAAPGPIGSVTPNTAAFTVVTAASFDTSAPATGETGEIGLQEDPANGNNTITLKAPANLASDVILTLPAGVAPASATATGTPGQWWYDANYWYVCVATNTWVRAPLATW